MSELLIEDTLGKRVKVLLKRDKLRYSDLSEVTGLAESTISDIVNDRVIPRSDTLKIISDYFHVSTDYLLCKTDDPDEINHDREIIGLSVEAAQKLREGDVSSAVINGIIESENADVFSNAVQNFYTNSENGIYESSDEVWGVLSDLIDNSSGSVPDSDKEIKRDAKILRSKQGEFYNYDKANAVREFENILDGSTPESTAAPDTTFKDIISVLLNGKDKIEPKEIKREMGIGESDNITPDILAEYVVKCLIKQEESKAYPNMTLMRMLGHKEKLTKTFAAFYKLFE